MYVFAIIFTGQLGKVPELQLMFGEMGLSMLTLFVNGTLLDDLTGVLRDILTYGGQTWVWVFIVFILLSAFTVLNMLIGVLCEVVTKTAAEETEGMLIRDVQEKLQK